MVNSLKELEHYLRQKEGEYGVRRLQRASDEIPNLEHMFTPEALRQVFSGGNTQALMTMDPADFEKYSSPILEQTRDTRGERLPTKANLPTADYIRHLKSIGRFDEVPMLQASKDEAGLPLTPVITGHEGRHRSRAMAQAGKKKSLVALEPRSELRPELHKIMPREDYIEAMKKELEMTNKLVVPQRYTESKDNGWTETPVHRPAIQLPNIYAKGGTVQSNPSLNEMRQAIALVASHAKDNGIPLEHMQRELMQHMGKGKKKMAMGGPVTPAPAVANSVDMQAVGINEAPSMPVKEPMMPATPTDNNAMPTGGVDFQPQQPGTQLAPAPVPPQGPAGQGQAPQGQQPEGQPPIQLQPGQENANPAGPQSNILSMTPQGQAMSAMQATPPVPPPARMAKGGKVKKAIPVKGKALIKEKVTVAPTGDAMMYELTRAQRFTKKVK
jgi:hypothetical protein